MWSSARITSFYSVIPDLVSVSYTVDPGSRWYLPAADRSLWRVMFRVAAEERERTNLHYRLNSRSRLWLGSVPGIDRYDIAHTTLYRVHQRVAKTFRSGRAFLIGDAAHVNNPSRRHGYESRHPRCDKPDRTPDEVSARHEVQAELDRFDLQRRLVTEEHVQRQEIQNKKKS